MTSPAPIAELARYREDYPILSDSVYMNSNSMGAMSMRLLRPIHPFFAFASSHVAAVPFRTAVAMPFAIGSAISRRTTTNS